MDIFCHYKFFRQDTYNICYVDAHTGAQENIVKIKRCVYVSINISYNIKRNMGVFYGF